MSDFDVGAGLRGMCGGGMWVRETGGKPVEGLAEARAGVAAYEVLTGLGVNVELCAASAPRLVRRGGRSSPVGSPGSNKSKRFVREMVGTW